MRPNRLHCPIRHENGNCTCVGGFCTAVPDPVCEAVRNAYDSGWTDCALKVRKEQRLKASPTIEAEPVRHGCEYCIGLPQKMRESFTMPNASKRDFDIVTIKFCPMCGAKMDGDSHD